MDLSFSKAEPLLRSCQRLTHGPEQELVHIDVLRLAHGDGNSPRPC